MIKLKKVTIKNFLSIGAVEQVLDLTKTGISLILGENIDLGGCGQRNGVGKSSILNSISYALYGQALTNIKRDNLINMINKKNMVVSIEFEANNHTYKIERGRKPNFIKFYVDDNVSSEDTDEAQGESRETQAEINKVLGMSHEMFKHIVALNTSTEPFLNMGAAKQRLLIEELLGITMLSEKANNLKELINSTKIEIDKEELVIKTIRLSNERIQNTIADVETKATNWDKKQAKTLEELVAAMEALATLDIDEELKKHEDLKIWLELDQCQKQFESNRSHKQRHLNQLNAQMNKLIANYEHTAEKKCPTCHQSIDAEQHQKMTDDLETAIGKLDAEVTTETAEISNIELQLAEVVEAKSTISKPTTFYNTLTQALNHKNTLDQLAKDWERESEAKNPFTGQAADLANTIQEINFDNLNTLSKQKDHQEFLYKLLTNKDSFIRKKIIDQNLNFLNNRLNEYLEKLGLPHNVIFQNDLTVEIMLLGQDLDFSQLSRGERTRLILGLSWAFRDIFESSVENVNLMFIDELLDQGIDSAGMENALGVLKKMERERNKDVFVISHREELVSRVSQVLTVIKENGFTRFDWDYQN